ncbi:hypothetical protein AABB02_33735 [Streptomyces rimosus]|uniref:hypothetical protein n=1 Tax=Streptomyces rimosus TaxID=1927 RepID=UPI0031E1DD13
MTPGERRRLLGTEVIARIHREVDAAPPPPPDVIAELRRILAPALDRNASGRCPEAA